MKIDLEIISKMLNAFIESESAHVNLLDVVKSICTERSDDTFIFHYSILVENGLVSKRDLTTGTLKDMGINYNLNGDLTVVNLPVRLTQDGHDFAKALANREVLDKLKGELKDAPFKVIFDGGQKLLQHYFKKKIDDLTA